MTHIDVCSGADLPEVEIVSLLAEELPRYTLRADHLFGYEHDDWLHTPLLPPEAALGLTYEQIDETFKYFCKSCFFRVHVLRVRELDVHSSYCRKCDPQTEEKWSLTLHAVIKLHSKIQKSQFY